MKKDYRETTLVFGKVRCTGRQGFKRVYSKDSRYHRKFQQYCWNNGFYTQAKRNGFNKPVYTCLEKEWAELFGM